MKYDSKIINSKKKKGIKPQAQGTYPRTEPTVGQAHRIFFHAQNSAQRFHWMF